MAPDRDGCPDRVIVLLDANALMMPAEFRVDLFPALTNLMGAYRPLVLRGVLRELQGLAASKGRSGVAARSALALAERCTVVGNDENNGSVDEDILQYADKERCVVVTNDRQLRQALLDRGISVISLAGKKRLEIYRR